MSEPVTILISGDPVGKGRPRIAMVAGHARAFTPAKTRNQEGYVKLLASQEMAGREPMDGPVEAVIRIMVAVPSYWSHLKRQAAIRGAHRPAVRPDLDNIVKLILDACNGIVYRDDNRIVRLVAEKTYAPAGSIVATFIEVAAPAPLLEQAPTAESLFA